jgi:hypothetical protein
MRAKLCAHARRLPGGLLLALVLALVACGTSPTEQLTRAETMLNRLESKGADQYLIYQMAEIRRGIETAKKNMRNNQIEVAYRSLNAICERLDSCGTAFISLRNKAATASQQRAQTLTDKLEALEHAITQLPRQTYVDQNRYDIQVHRLRRYHEELAGMQELIQKQDFPKALDRGDMLAQQVNYMLAGLKPYPMVVSKEKRGVPTAPLTPPAEKPANAAGMLAATAH